MAFAALITLSQTLEEILHSCDQQSRLVHEEQHIRSLHEKLGSLVSVLEDSSPRDRKSITRLERRVTELAYEVEDLIDSHMAKQILSESSSRVEEEYEQGLRKVTEEVNSVLEEMEKMKGANDIEVVKPSITDILSRSSSSHNQISIEGLDDDLMPVKYLLIGQPSKLESMTNVKTGVEEVVKMSKSNILDDLQIKQPLPESSPQSASTNTVELSDDLHQMKEGLINRQSSLEEEYEEGLKEIENLNSISEKMKEIDDIKGLKPSIPADGSSKSSFPDPIKDLLTRQTSVVESMPVVEPETENVVQMSNSNDLEDLQPKKSMPASSSQSVSTNTMGLNEDLHQIKELLTGQSSVEKGNEGGLQKEVENLNSILEKMDTNTIEAFQPGNLPDGSSKSSLPDPIKDLLTGQPSTPESMPVDTEIGGLDKMSQTHEIEEQAKKSSASTSYKSATEGFNDDLLQVQEPLIDERSSELQIIPIVGMGGIEEVVKMSGTNDLEDLQQNKSLPAYSSQLASMTKSTTVETHQSKQILSVSARAHGVMSCFEELIHALCCCARFMVFKDQDSDEKYEEGSLKIIQDFNSLSEEEEMMKDINDIEGLQPRTPVDGSSKSGSRDPTKNLLSGQPSKLENNSVLETQIAEVMKVISWPASSSQSASTNKNATVGLDDNILEIKKRLIEQSSEVKIIPIVGMGGIGKSTLARNIYGDSYIMDRFDIRAWITVSQNYYLRELIIGLLNSMTDYNLELNGKKTEDLKMKLYQSLKGKRYLVVIDDIWDPEAWNEVKQLFPNDRNGSRIILTTRESSVAVKIDSSVPIHKLNFLSPEQSWDLLCLKVFGEDSCPQELEGIGKNIAKICKGLPLALVVVGGLLYKGERTPAYWRYVAENVVSTVNRDYDDIFEILSWSYDNLPYHLRACFLYMGVFPEDYVIHVLDLIWLWVSEGFLNTVVTKSLEQVAKEYLEDLIDRNLILAHELNYQGEVTTCKIHDLMRDLCMRKAQEEKFLDVANQFKIPPEILKNHRRVSIHRGKQYDLVNMKESTLRSLLYFGESVSSFPIHDFQRLKVLDACHITFNKFPTEIVKLVKLRYVALIYNGKAKIPVSISKLQNLETLIIFRRQSMLEQSMLTFPVEIWDMTKLRHLLSDYAYLPQPNDTQNTNLQTISGVHDFTCSRQSHPNLKILQMSYGYHSGWSDYCLQNLAHLHQLERLKCCFNAFSSSIPMPARLAFPPNLKKLTFSYCKLSWQKMSIIGSLSNLEFLKLKQCPFEGTTWKTNEGEFEQLKFLHLYRSNMVNWETEESHFPSLERLVLDHCMDIDAIPSQIGQILTLQQIVLIGCRSSTKISTNSIKEEQHEIGNEGFQLLFYPYGHKYRAPGGKSFRKMYISRAVPPEILADPIAAKKKARKQSKKFLKRTLGTELWDKLMSLQ